MANVIWLILAVFSLNAGADACDGAGVLNLIGQVEMVSVKGNHSQVIAETSFTKDTPPFKNSGMELEINGKDIEPRSAVFLGKDGSSLVVGRSKHGFCALLFVDPSPNTFPFFGFVQEVTSDQIKVPLGQNEWLLVRKKSDPTADDSAEPSDPSESGFCETYEDDCQRDNDDDGIPDNEEDYGNP